jgi:hypothetical protein
MGGKRVFLTLSGASGEFEGLGWLRQKSHGNWNEIWGAEGLYSHSGERLEIN